MLERRTFGAPLRTSALMASSSQVRLQAATLRSSMPCFPSPAQENYRKTASFKSPRLHSSMFHPRLINATERDETDDDEHNDLLHMHTAISGVQERLLLLQKENSMLKKSQESAMQKLAGKYYYCFGGISLARAFTEWRDYTRRRSVARAMETFRASEIERHESEVRGIHLREAALIQTVESHGVVIDTMRAELMSSKSRVEELELKLLDAERRLAIVREGVKEHQPDEVLLAIERNQADGTVSEFMKDKLHEILRSTDSRYLGRSLYPTVAEISSQERKAYSEQSVCSVGDKCLAHHPPSFDRTRPLSPSIAPLTASAKSITPCVGDQRTMYKTNCDGEFPVG